MLVQNVLFCPGNIQIIPQHNVLRDVRHSLRYCTMHASLVLTISRYTCYVLADHCVCRGCCCCCCCCASLPSCPSTLVQVLGIMELLIRRPKKPLDAASAACGSSGEMTAPITENNVILSVNTYVPGGGSGLAGRLTLTPTLRHLTRGPCDITGNAPAVIYMLQDRTMQVAARPMLLPSLRSGVPHHVRHHV